MGTHDGGTYAVAVRDLFPASAARRPLRWVVAGVVVLLTGVAGVPAAGADEARPTNYESVIDAVRPNPTTVRIEIVGGDAFVQVTVEPGTEVQIPGYDGEPYLRVDADGTVLRNRRSAATYINEERYGDTEPLPDRVDAAAAPDWERIGDGGVVAWHDHRVHWMLDSPPRTGDGVVQPWTVPMSVDGAEVQVEGRLLLRSDQFPWPAIVGVAAAALALWRAQRELTRTLLLASAAAVATVSSVSWFMVNPPGSDPSILPVLLPALALVAALAARAAPTTARHLVLPLAAAALLIGWFVQRVGVMWMPTLPTPVPELLERVLTAGVGGVALGVAVAIVLRPYPEGVVPAQAAMRGAVGSQPSTPPRS